MLEEELDVTVPDGVGPGELLSVTGPDGGAFEVAVPDGLAPGDAVAALSEEQAEVIRAVLLAIEDSAELDDFVNVQCDQFGEYVEGREQKLEYQELYTQYQNLLEGIIEGALHDRGATSADLFEVLQAARQDGKASLFLDRFVAMESYDDFCGFMGEWSTLTMWQRQHVNKDRARENIRNLGKGD